MPELPEVEIVKRGMEGAMLGPSIKTLRLMRPDMRYPFTPGMEKSVKGRAVQSLERRGKYIIAHLEGSLSLVLHLGMSGSVRIFKAGEAYTPALHDHAVFTLNNGGTLALNDPRRFGFLLMYHGGAWQNDKPFSAMGPEPLGNAFSGPVLAERIKGRKAPIKPVLLDQTVVAGLGNIYVCEALYESAISPLRPAGDLKGKECEALASSIRGVLTRAIEAGGSSLRDYRHTDGGLGCFQHSFSVYDREGEACPHCDGACRIDRIVQAGRSTFYCSRRQH